MPKFYCEYCSIYLTHSSPAGRKQHSQGRKHISAKVEYFQRLVREQFFQPPVFLGQTPPIFPGNFRAINHSLGPPMMGVFPGFAPLQTPNIIPQGMMNGIPGGLPGPIPGVPPVPVPMPAIPVIPTELPNMKIDLNQHNAPSVNSTSTTGAQ
ncbi:RNA-binding protein (U1 snRNP-like), putative [Theileria annulata]|uniref:U1 small nuclear ribonucleoprotein C n=1 Tax=Theileria annulata TaxID=5874 RepID=RU1C_THEAN|nr:RNA-binding protein (U1 snRNP-like), putative [Theileria annulata]Q4UJ14.1 RecName: Full=U1 small nuclear ribonucleoprotein C; Short=U1 snRNP C; Short=U1-C; Short=U1C [Theileria annulata]CAI72925.1 RNA-binding protein (U1 snRNP-like), putative [Theileria annulata]|eukprot:XP_953603.1 RNA-binding protein (U1 snRNP-like), putative [Theileria annulata]